MDRQISSKKSEYTLKVKVIIFDIKIAATKNPHKHSDIEGMKTNVLLLGALEKLFLKTESPFLASSSLVTKWVLTVQLLLCDAY